MCMCVCMRVLCVCTCVWGGSCRATSSLVIPGHLAMASLIVRRGTVGLASQSVPCVAPVVTQKSSASKTKKSVSQCSSDFASCDFFHAKSKTRIACWNVRCLGSLSDQCAPLQNVLATMKERNIDLLALSESRWPGSGICNVRSRTILHSGTPSSHVHGMYMVLLLYSVLAPSHPGMLLIASFTLFPNV